MTNAKGYLKMRSDVVKDLTEKCSQWDRDQVKNQKPIYLS
jgi:hypothetical protein